MHAGKREVALAKAAGIGCFYAGIGKRYGSCRNAKDSLTTLIHMQVEKRRGFTGKYQMLYPTFQ